MDHSTQKRGSNLQVLAAPYGVNEAYVEVPGHRLNSPVEQAVGHPCIEQGRDHATVQHAVVSLVIGLRPEAGPDPSVSVGFKVKATKRPRVAVSAKQASRVS